MTNVIQLARRNPPSPSSSVAQSRGGTDRAQFSPTANFPVGQREGRLSERFPADRSWAALAGFFDTVQGNRLSHSFLIQASRTLLKWMLCLFGGAVITGLVFVWLLFF